jgi:hypothetical protein
LSVTSARTSAVTSATAGFASAFIPSSAAFPDARSRSSGVSFGGFVESGRAVDLDVAGVSFDARSG